MNIVTIVTARYDSQRLPGKALLPLNNKPMLWHVVDRARKAELINDVMVATSIDSKPIIDFCLNYGIPYFAGAENDILSRLYCAAGQAKADIVVRLWGDCPFILPHVIDKVIQCYLENHPDYAYNVGFPSGEDVAVIGFTKLEELCLNLKEAKDREWIHKHVIEHPDLYDIKIVEQKPSLTHLKWSVDTLEDYERMKVIFQCCQE